MVGAVPPPLPSPYYSLKLGDHPLRSIWYQGGGGASLEWFTITPNKALLNDTGNGGLATFAESEPATSVTSVSPASGGVRSRKISR